MIKGFLKDDVLLMTTDGLTNLVKKEDLYKTVKEENLEQIQKRLVEKALENGGFDNITVIVIKNI